MLILALDVGSSSTRAACFDERVAPVPGAEGRVAYEPRTTPDGGAELDPDRLLGAVIESVDACLHGLGARASSLGGVGISTFWHGLLALDVAGHPLTPVITWADTRSAAAAAALRATQDEGAVHRRTGAPLRAPFWPAKLRWLAETRPEVMRGARTWCGFGEYLLARLTGELRSSSSMASGTGLLDEDACAWDMPLLRALALDPERLPRLDDAPVMGLAEPYATRWPGLARVPWFPPWGDGACSNLGSGCDGPERVALNLGTSAALRVVLRSVGATPWGLFRYRVDRRRNLVGGATSEGGNVLAWCRRTLALPADVGALDAAVAALGPDAHGLTALPFLAGERSPGWRPDSRAAVVGASLGTGAVEILRAMMEAVAYRLAMIYERLAGLAPGARIVVSGGALAHMPSWATIIADVLGAPLTVASDREASARGAALLALAALGSPAPAVPVTGQTVVPDGSRHERYCEALERHRKVYERIVGPEVS